MGLFTIMAWPFSKETENGWRILGCGALCLAFDVALAFAWRLAPRLARDRSDIGWTLTFAVWVLVFVVPSTAKALLQSFAGG